MRKNDSQQILIIGAGGFIGTNLCAYLNASGQFDITALSRSDALNSAHASSYEYTRLSITDWDMMREKVAGKDTVILLAHQTDAKITTQLLDICVEADVKKCIYASSGGTVYGNVATETPIKESADLHPISTYGEEKIATEELLQNYKDKGLLHTISLRIANPYGPYQFIKRKQGIIGAAFMSIINHESLTLYGDTVRDFIAMDDLCAAIKAAIVYEGGEPIFNIGSGISVRLTALMHFIEDITGEPLSIDHKDIREQDVHYNVLDISLAEKELGWTPEISLADGLKTCWDWYRKTYMKADV
ncbi:MAG: hypothetical protein CMH32_03870 [Micavibrio sp.]|nr:hypothetical protein [Micavibrio sp.]HCK32262.1 hypothetical protein [Rhodospirillaceae bacterium]